MLWRQLPVGPIQTNCYLAGCAETKEGVVIDPGEEPERILAAIKDLGLTIKYILNTHAHFDHILANGPLVKATGAPLALLSGLDWFVLDPHERFWLRTLGTCYCTVCC